MIIKLIRSDFSDQRTIGRLTFDDFECYSLEDCDRGLKDSMPIEGIEAIKIKHETAIPYGTYEIVISYSNRFKKMLPLLIGVKGFEGIRIHSGNVAADSSGCILLGLRRTQNSVLDSRSAMSVFMSALMKALKKEKVYITISKTELMLKTREGL